LYQDTIWCEDQASVTPKVAGATNCGDEGMTSKNEKCTYKGDCGDNKICHYVITLGGYGCHIDKDVCKDTPRSSCYKTDQLFADYGIEDKVCGGLVASIGDKCEYLNRFFCPTGWEQVDCNLGGGIDTPCWDSEDGIPKIIRIMLNDRSLEYPCADGRVGKGAASMCCGDIEDVNCRKPSDNSGRGCNPDEAPVDCSLYPPVEGLANCQADGKTLCCMELELKVH